MALVRSICILALTSSALLAVAEACSGSKESPDAGTEAGADGGRDGAPSDSGTGEAKDSPSDAGTPLLIELRVSSSAAGDSSATVTLVPRFSSTVYDYYVVCPAADNALDVSMKASAGSESLLIRPARSASAPAQTLSVSVHENDAIVAVAKNSSATTRYWVRCLPHDFPALTVDPHPEAGTPPPGYYLLGNQAALNGAGWAIVMDGHGVPVWYERFSTGIFNVDDVVPEALSFVPFPQPQDSINIHDFGTSKTTFVGHGVDPHEFRPLPKDKYLIVYSHHQYGVDLMGLSVKLSDGGSQAFGTNSTIEGCDIHQIDSSGNIEWKWLGTDHFDPVSDTVWPELSTTLTPDGGPVVDPFHCNSIDVDPANGNLLVSARQMNSVFYIERSTGRILWKMGGASYTVEGAPYISVTDPFVGQHDARLLPGWSSTCNGGAGQISLFDDESGKKSTARGVVYDVVVGGPDGGSVACDGGPTGAPRTATVAWQYQGTSNTGYSGSFRILPDGSRVIGWGAFNGPSLVMSEVDDKGHDLLDLNSSDGLVSYRVVKVPVAAFNLDVLRNSAGLP